MYCFCGLDEPITEPPNSFERLDASDEETGWTMLRFESQIETNSWKNFAIFQSGVIDCALIDGGRRLSVDLSRRVITMEEGAVGAYFDEFMVPPTTFQGRTCAASQLGRVYSYDMLTKQWAMSKL